MTYDEWIRAFCYFLLFPAYIYFGLITYNRRQIGVALTYFGLAAFFMLLFVGLVLGHYHHPVPVLLGINTGVVILVTLVTTWRATSIMLAALTVPSRQCAILQEIEHE